VQPHEQPLVFEDPPGAASAPLGEGYRPRQPHKSLLHKVVRENLLSFLADGQLRSDDGEGYPYYIEKELRNFVACADLSRGFARLRCKDCGFERLLPFSCKNRGICPLWCVAGHRVDLKGQCPRNAAIPAANGKHLIYTCDP
jgi:hypothetical protein